MPAGLQLHQSIYIKIWQQKGSIIKQLIFWTYIVFGFRMLLPFAKNYVKLYFDAKRLEKGLNKGGDAIFGDFFSKKGPVFHKKLPFLANMKCCLKFLEYALMVNCKYTNHLATIKPLCRIHKRI